MKEPYPIPVKINISIIVICSSLYFVLLYTGSHIHPMGVKLLLGLAFAIVMIPIYSLMHEAAHNALHPTPRWNLFLGRCLCILFFVSFSFFSPLSSKTS